MKTLKQLFTTKTGWLFICIVLTIVFGSLSNHSTFIENGSEFMFYLMFLPLSYIIIISLIMIIYAVINTIKNEKK